MKNSIQVKDLSKIFYTHQGEPSYALHQLNLTIPQGCIYGIIGTSGAGKSTLLRCLTGLEQPTSGSILLNGREFSNRVGKELSQLRLEMGMVFQNFHLFSSRTIKENIAYPLEIQGVPAKQREERINYLLSLTHLQNKGNHFPAHLSGGEKQRVAFARALAHAPRLLLCDEPTSALDPGTVESILQLLDQLNREEGLTILIITHQLECVKKICQRVAVLSKGEVVEEGEVKQVFTNPKAPFTRRLLKMDSGSIPPSLLYPREEGRALIRLGFEGERAREPIISQLLKRYDVEMNILSGGLDQIQNITVGNLLVELSGNKTALQEALEYLNDKQISFEVIA